MRPTSTSHHTDHVCVCQRESVAPFEVITAGFEVVVRPEVDVFERHLFAQGPPGMGDGQQFVRRCLTGDGQQVVNIGFCLVQFLFDLCTRLLLTRGFRYEGWWSPLESKRFPDREWLFYAFHNDVTFWGNDPETSFLVAISKLLWRITINNRYNHNHASHWALPISFYLFIIA